MSVCLFVSIQLTAEPIGPKFYVVPYRTPARERFMNYECSKF